MSKIIIGIDPDSKAHGVAVYRDGKLIELLNLDCIQLREKIVNLKNTISPSEIVFHIEDVKANNAVFMKPGRMDKKREGEAKARGRTLGMCQQSQTEVERLAEFCKIKVVKYKISKMWKKDKAQFEKVTGWTGRSNEDTRSAAYFGFLGLK